MLKNYKATFGHLSPPLAWKWNRPVLTAMQPSQG